MISAVILAKDNDGLIENLIRNVRQVAGEIVVVDTGSSDRTVELAKKNKAIVFSRKFCGDFADARNYGISQAKGEWILSIDTDELLSPELVHEIPKLIQNKGVDGYWIGCKTYISSDRYLKHGLFYPDRHLRLFRNQTKYRYQGQIHEQPNVPKERTADVRLGVDILHFPQHPKYTKLSDFRNLLPYMHIQAEYYQNKMGVPMLIFTGFYQILRLFTGGYLRGQGFLDGFDGFRAHLFFACSIGGAYFMAAGKRLKAI